MDDVTEYLENIVEPTFTDYRSNPESERLAFLTCVAIYHVIDRFTHPKGPGNLRNKWGKLSLEFKIVDMMAHHFKHVKSDDDKIRLKEENLLLSKFVFNNLLPDKGEINDKCTLHNMYFIIRDAIQFVRQQSEKRP